MKYHGKEGEESSLYRALGNRLRVAVLRTTFHFLQLNTVWKGVGYGPESHQIRGVAYHRLNSLLCLLSRQHPS